MTSVVTRTLSSLLILSALLATAPIVANATTPDLYAKSFQDIHAPGTAIIEFNSDGITREQYFGIDGDGFPITQDTPFVWGALSQSITAAIALKLHNDGALDLHDPIVNHLPELASSALDANHVEIAHLIQHTAGLPTNLAHSVATVDELLKHVADLEHITPPGTHNYSNIGYSLLQEILTRSTNQEFSTLVHQHIDLVCGSGPTISDSETFHARVPKGHQPFFFTHKSTTVEPWPISFGVAYLSGSGQQFAAYAVWQLQQHQRSLHNPLAHAQVSDNLKYGPGLHYKQVRLTDGTSAEYVYHTGSVWGYTSYVGFIPKTNRGIIIFTNELGIRTQYDTQRRNAIHTLVSHSLDIDEPQKPKLFPADTLVLTAEFVVIALLFGALAFQIKRWSPNTPPTDPKHAFRRTALPLFAGTCAALALFYGVPFAYGHQFDEISIGAPDVFALFCTIMMQIHLLTALAVLREIIAARRLSRSQHLALQTS